MGIIADETVEERLVSALKFVKVVVQDGRGPMYSGYMTDVSVAMILVEMRRNGLTLSVRQGER